jgi:hypothetical protein
LPLELRKINAMTTFKKLTGQMTTPFIGKLKTLLKTSMESPWKLSFKRRDALMIPWKCWMKPLN